MGYEKGLVSVIIPTYKRCDKIARAINSVLCQEYSNLELLLINDNEKDDQYTKDLLRIIEPFFEDPRFRFILQEKHINGAAARNYGIKLSKGEYIAFLDDDDWWDRQKLSKQVKELSKLDESFGCVSCKFSFFDKNEKLIGKTVKYRDGYIYKDILFLLTDVATGTLLIRHEALDKTGYFDEELLRHQDLQLLVKFTSLYKLKEVDEYLHCCDVSDSQNRLDGDKLLIAKQKFYISIKTQLDLLTKKELKCVYAINDFEIGYVYLKSKRFLKWFKYSIHIFKSLMAIKVAYKKILLKVL